METTSSKVQDVLHLVPDQVSFIKVDKDRAYYGEKRYKDLRIKGVIIPLVSVITNGSLGYLVIKKVSIPGHGSYIFVSRAISGNSRPEEISKGNDAEKIKIEVYDVLRSSAVTKLKEAWEVYKKYEKYVDWFKEEFGL